MTPLRLGLRIADGVSAAVVFLIASIARFGDGHWVQIWSDLGLDIRGVAVLFGIAWGAALWYRGMYQLRTRWRLQSEVSLSLDRYGVPGCLPTRARGPVPADRLSP